MVNYNLERIAKDILTELEADLQRVGIMHRIFFRCKSYDSISTKIQKKGYDGVNSFLRDIIGLRINVYFVDDLVIVGKIVKHRFKKMEEEIDQNNETEFKPSRINYVFRIPEKYEREFREIVSDSRIDCTFELQLRTVLSEGWHEVEHDLRYKQKSHWVDHQDLSRVFNGILASLETNDWSVLSMLEKLTYRHYKDENWDAMIRTKVRLRIKNEFPLREQIISILNANRDLAKRIFRLDRALLLDDLYTVNVKFPLTIDNMIFFINSKYIGNEELNRLVPDPLKVTFLHTDGHFLQN
jgi:putative GTP pyrophosphokinase